MHSLQEILKKHDLRNTQERRDVFSYFQSHTTADAQELQQYFSSMSRSSIFRILHLFCQIEILRKIPLGKNTVYEFLLGNASHTHHEHMICTLCDNILHFESAHICSLLAKKAEEYHFSLTNHSLSVYGICSRCQKNTL